MSSYLQQNQSYLVQLIPPANKILPNLQQFPPMTLFPLQQMKLFQGKIQQNQKLHNTSFKVKTYQGQKFHWIGNAFYDIIYRRYPNKSYQKISNRQELWNLYICDLNLYKGQKPQPKKQQIKISAFYNLKDDNDETLIFESRFQSGNLSLVSRVTVNQYNLLLQNDINTKGYTQWFFFKVSNTKQKKKVKFNILNLYKQETLYKSGMKILVYSKKKGEKNNISWFRGGQQINYYQNGLTNGHKNPKKFYTLTWKYEFQYQNDQVYFAYNYPYTYTDLNIFLKFIQQDQLKKKYLKRTLLTKSVLGNRVDLLTITSNVQMKKKYIVISARVHAGQTVSSYVVKGIIKYLLSSHQKAIRLRDNFIFKIIPMLNPDGVIHGNYRTNLSGKDLNRVWQFPSQHLHPEIYYLKKLIFKLQNDNEVLLFCDLHGHSVKKNCFMYGCHNSKYPFQGKQFPFLISKICRGFDFKDCRFLSSQIREGSARSTLYKQLQMSNIFTLQSSFCGPDYDNIHFSIGNFQDIGRKFCEALQIYLQPNIKESKRSKNKAVLQFRENSLKQLYLNKGYLKQTVKNQNSQGSEPDKQEQNALNDDLIKKCGRDQKRSFSQKKSQANIGQIWSYQEPSSPKLAISQISVKKISKPKIIKKISQRQDNQKSQKILKIKPTIFSTDNFLRKNNEQEIKNLCLSQVMKKSLYKSQNNSKLTNRQTKQTAQKQTKGNQSNFIFQKIPIPNKFECLQLQGRQFKSKVNNVNFDRSINNTLIPKLVVSPQKIKKGSSQNLKIIPIQGPILSQQKKYDFFFERKKQIKTDYNIFKNVLKSLKVQK